MERLLGDAGIVRHRGKIEATLNNARRAVELVDEFGSIPAFVWRFEPSSGSRPQKLTEAAMRAMTTSAERARRDFEVPR